MTLQEANPLRDVLGHARERVDLEGRLSQGTNRIGRKIVVVATIVIVVVCV